MQTHIIHVADLQYACMVNPLLAMVSVCALLKQFVHRQCLVITLFYDMQYSTDMFALVSLHITLAVQKAWTCVSILSYCDK